MRKNRLFLLHKTRPRLAVAMATGGLLLLLLPESWRHATRLVTAWDSGTALYLLLAMKMMAQSDINTIRGRAAMQDEGRLAILALTTLGALASLAAIVAELATAKTLHGHAQWQHIALAGLTVFLSWSFMHMMFALHYAHEYYTPDDDGEAGGLEFPGPKTAENLPDYWDFVYYAFIIGTACATADINTLSKPMRNLTTAHCIVSFFFNTTILALMINIGAGLL